MKLSLLKICVASILLASTPTFAAPQWVESLCLYHANRVRPAFDFLEREAYVANCIADWTVGTPPPPRGSKNTNRNRY